MEIMKIFLLILLFSSADSPADPQQQQHCKRKFVHLTSKRTFYSAPVSYYSNHCSCNKLLLCGDIEINPGPVLCTSCNETVRINSKRLECLTCREQLHYKCSKMKIQFQNSRVPYQWTCHSCTLSLLPYFGIRALDDSDAAVGHDPADEFIPPSVALLNEHRQHLSVAHLNTQSMTSTFPQFETFLTTHKFDIVTLSETV